VKRTFRHLSLSIACTRKSLKKQSWCDAIFLASEPLAKLFDGISDGKKVSSDSTVRKYRHLIRRIAKYAANKGIVGIEHRRASGIVEFFTNGPQPSGRNVS
jgi:hypothetical protein